MLREKCKDISRSSFAKVASVLKTAAVAAGVSLADNGIEFLSRLERGEGSASTTT
jgi:hypothetical protein